MIPEVCMRPVILATLWMIFLFGNLAPAADSPTWRGQEIDPAIGKVCYAVVTADVNGDSKPDVVAVANDAVVWYENPSWQKHDIIRDSTEPDNVCLQPYDVDGDGRVDFALGSAWRPTDTKTGGNLAIITRTGAPEGTWRVVPIGSEPTLHRVRWGNVLARPDRRPQLIMAPLQGRGTKGPDWGDGAGSRIVAWEIPDSPFESLWPSTLLTDQSHTVHNLEFIDAHRLVLSRHAFPAVLFASWEGVYLYQKPIQGDQKLIKIGSGNQESRPNHGSSEVKLGHRRDGLPFVATIEPWHGNQFVVYQGAKPDEQFEMARHVIDESLAWGHAVWCADLDADGDDEVVVGQRDPNKQADAEGRGPGVIIYDPKPGSYPIAFDRTWVDQGGVAVEDLVVADLNGDGRPEIIAGGRATHNVKIYWNEVKPAQ